jgi:hypothetical protein
MLNMSNDQQVIEETKDDRRLHGKPPRDISSKELARMILDIGTSDLVLKGKLPGRLTQDEVNGLVNYLNTPLSDAELEEMDRVSSINSRLSPKQVYAILALHYEGHMNFNDLAKMFGISTKYLSSIKRGTAWTGVFYRYCRDRNIDPQELAAR